MSPQEGRGVEQGLCSVEVPPQIGLPVRRRLAPRAVALHLLAHQTPMASPGLPASQPTNGPGANRRRTANAIPCRGAAAFTVLNAAR